MINVRYFFYTVICSIIFFTSPTAKSLNSSDQTAGQMLVEYGSFLLNIPDAALLSNPTEPYVTETVFLGKPTTVTVDKKQMTTLNGKPDNIKFLLEFATPFIFKLSPWHTINFQTLTYEVVGKKQNMKTTFSLFGLMDDTTIEYLAETKKNKLTKQLEQIETFLVTSHGMTFNQLIPIFQGKPYTETIIEKFESKIEMTEQKTTASFNFSLYLQQLFPSLNFSATDGITQFSGSFSDTGHYNFTGSMKEEIILARNVATLSNVIVSLSNTQVKKGKDIVDREAISLEATLGLSLPKNDKLSCIVKGSIINGELSALIGELDYPVKFNGIEITGIKVTINFAAGTIELVGMATMLEKLKVEAGLRINNLIEPNTPQVLEKPTTITFLSRAISNEGFSPFGDIPGLNLGPLKSIKLTKLEFSFDTQNNLIISGACSILGIKAKASMKKTFNFAQDGATEETSDAPTENEDANTKASGATTGAILLKASPDEPMETKDLSPALTGTPLASLDLPNPEIFVASQEMYDPESQMYVPQGGSIATSVDTTSPFLVPVKKLLGGLPARLGVLLPLIADKETGAVTISIALPPSASIQFDSKTKLEQLRFLLSVSPIKVLASIKGNIFTHLPYQDEPVVFVAGCDFDAQPEALGVVLKASMLGYWENVFTIKGLNLGDIGLEAGIDFIPVTPFVVPKTVGFRGSLDLGGPIISMGTKVSTDGDFVLEGALDGSINFRNLIKLANKIGVPIPNNVPKNLAEIRDVVAKIATKTTTIGEFVYRQGIEFRGTITLFGKTATTDIAVNKYGILAEGSLEEIKIDGILKVTGKGLAHSETDGPAFKIALTPLEQCIYLNGSINLFGASYESDIYVSPMRAHFTTNYNLFNLVEMTLEGTSQTTKGLPDFYIRGEYTNGLDISISKEDLKKALKYINHILSDGGNLLDRINDLEKKINERHKYLMHTNKRYAKNQEELDAAQKSVRTAEDEVKKLDRRIKKLSKRLHVERIAPNNDSLLSKTNQELYNKLYKAVPNHTAFAQKQSPVLLAKINLGKTFKKLGHDVQHGINKGIDKTKDFAEDTAHHTKKAINTGIDHAEDIIDQGIHHTEKAINQGIDHTEDIINQGIHHTEKFFNKAGDFIEDSAQLVSDAGELAALKAAREVAILTLESAQAGLIAAEEINKMSDGKIAKWRAEQAALGIQYGATQAGLQTAKLMIEGAIETYPAVKWLTSIHIKEVSISAALSNPLPKFRCAIRAFDKIDTVIEFNSNPEEAFEYLMNQVLLLLKDL